MSVENIRAYNTVECGSDHRIVSARIKIKLRVEQQNKCTRTKFDWAKLKASEQLQAQFHVAVRNRFLALQEECGDSGLQAKYNSFERSVEETANELLGKLKKPKTKHWVSKSTTDLLMQRNQAKKTFKSSCNPRDKQVWQELNKQLESSYVNDQMEHLEGKLKQLKSAAASGRLRTTWEIVNELGGKNMSKQQHKMKRADGGRINNKNDLREEWKNHFCKLLNNVSSSIETGTIQPALEDLDINVGPITYQETYDAVHELKNGKAPGCDYSITPEALKYGGLAIIEILHQICNEVYNQETAPRQLTTNIIVPLAKKGDLTLMTNYRGISLTSMATKVYNKILFNRIREPIDKILRPNQAGFRRGRSCTEQVHIICRLIESADDKNLSLYITFVDFKKAFDSIDRRKMFEILHHYGIPDKLVRAIKTIYNNSKSAVLVEGGLTEEFEITTGVLQGDTLAPFLFIIVIDYVLKNAELNHATIHGINEGENGFVTQPRQCRRQPVTAIFDLDFADDLALLEGNLERAQSQLNEIAKQAEQVGLVVNVKKTEAFTNQDKSKNLELGNQKIEWVNNFKYLGSMVKSSETDISVRKALAWAAFWKMKDIFRSNTLPIRLKTNIFQAACLSILLYGCESWILTEKLKQCLNSFATNCYRVMLNIKRLDRVSNVGIYQKIGIDPLDLQIQRRQLRYVGHCLRKQEHELINKYILYQPIERHGCRKRGRPKLLYPQYIGTLINIFQNG
ncbi:endonuclease-reverse transcriptase [Labeo rohita]|uniref:Endonuclease-reverse transcriptase n=1 Tax=Labeo rohita TaxID=84645 RepID=A0A498NZX4_LABRO|nr:endonuclease-reverse transcriptase [Labeo rohita]